MKRYVMLVCVSCVWLGSLCGAVEAQKMTATVNLILPGREVFEEMSPPPVELNLEVSESETSLPLDQDALPAARTLAPDVNTAQIQGPVTAPDAAAGTTGSLPDLEEVMQNIAAAVPEPSTIVLVGLGLLGLLGLARRKGR